MERDGSVFDALIAANRSTTTATTTTTAIATTTTAATAATTAATVSHNFRWNIDVVLLVRSGARGDGWHSSQETLIQFFSIIIVIITVFVELIVLIFVETSFDSIVDGLKLLLYCASYSRHHGDRQGRSLGTC